jgi:hypothetical protein
MSSSPEVILKPVKPEPAAKQGEGSGAEESGRHEKVAEEATVLP